MFRWIAVLFIVLGLVACGGSGGGSTKPDENTSPPDPTLAGAWQGQLIYQSSQTTEPVTLAIYDDLAWIKIGSSRAAGFQVEQGGDEITLSGKIYSGHPVRWGNAVKHPAYKDLQTDSPEIEITLAFEGRDAVGSFEILKTDSPKDYGVFSLMPAVIEDGSWQPQKVSEAEFTCGESGGHPLYCYSNIDLFVDSDGVVSGEYRDYHKYAERPPEMLSTVPSSFEITGLSDGLEAPGFYSIEAVAPRLDMKGFGYRTPNGELEYCLMGGLQGTSPDICP